MKKNVILILFLTFSFSSSFAQNLEKEIQALRIFYTQRLDSLNTISKSDISQYHESYYCCISYQIDAQGRVIDFLILEDNERPLSAWTKEYITALFKKANGISFSGEENDLPSQLSKERHLLPVVIQSVNQPLRDRSDNLSNMGAFIMQTEGLFPHYSPTVVKTVFLNY